MGGDELLAKSTFCSAHVRRHGPRSFPMSETEDKMCCNGCGKPLAGVQIMDIVRAQADPKYSRWCREGFCSHRCWDVHHPAEPKDESSCAGKDVSISSQAQVMAPGFSP